MGTKSTLSDFSNTPIITTTIRKFTRRECRGVCLHYTINRRGGGKNSEPLFKCITHHCSFCDIYMDYPSVWCPCCGEQMRSKLRTDANSKKRNREWKKQHCKMPINLYRTFT